MLAHLKRNTAYEGSWVMYPFCTYLSIMSASACTVYTASHQMGMCFQGSPPICQNINIETPPPFLAVINIDFLAVLVVVSSFTFLPFPSLTFVPAAAISMYRPFITLKPLGKGCPSAASQRCCAKGNKERPVFTLFKFSFYQKLNHSKTI